MKRTNEQVQYFLTEYKSLSVYARSIADDLTSLRSEMEADGYSLATELADEDFDVSYRMMDRMEGVAAIIESLIDLGARLTNLKAEDAEGSAE